MFRIVKHIARSAAHAALTLCAFLLIVVAIGQIAVIVGISILTSGKGTSFFEGKINAALEESGYQVSFKDLYYDTVRGFTVKDLSVEDAQGPFLHLDRFSLSVSLTQIPLRDLRMAGYGGTLTLLRLPVEDPVEPGSEEPYAMAVPDIFFNKITVQALSFKAVTLAEDIAGKPVTFSPSLKGGVRMGEEIAFTVNLQPGLAAITPDIPGPEDITLQGTFIPQTQAISLETLDISGPVYKLEAAGNATLADEGTSDLQIQARYDDLTAITAGNMQEASADVKISGPWKNPALNLSGKIIPASLKERGVGDIEIVLTTESLEKTMVGHARIATTFKKENIILEGDLSYEAAALRIENLKGSAPHLDMTGGGVFSTDTTLFDGTLKISADDLAHYKDLLSTELRGKIQAEGVFKPNGEEQSMAVKAIISDGVYDTISVRKIDGKAQFDSLANPWPQAADVTADNLTIGKYAKFTKISATVSHVKDQQYKLSLKGNGTAPVATSFDGSALLSNPIQPAPSAENIEFTARFGRSAATLSGAFSPEKIDLSLKADKFRGSDIPTDLPNGFDDIMITADAVIGGTPDRPVTDVKADISSIDVGDLGSMGLAITAKHDGAQLQASLSGTGKGIRSLRGNLSAPMTLSLVPFAWDMNSGTAITGNIDGDLDIASIAPLFLPPTQNLSGILTFNSAISGMMSDPAISGTTRLTQAAFSDDANGISLLGLNADAAFTQEGITLNRLSATDGKEGTLTGQGSMKFDQGSDAHITLQMRRFNIPDTDLANGLIDADLSLRSVNAGVNVTGAIDVQQMNVLIPETFQSNIPELNIVEPNRETNSHAAARVNLAIKINAPNQIFVRGWGLDAEFGGNIDISGTATNPQFNGTLSSRRGRYEEFGKRFTLKRANLRFQGDVPPSPYLDVEATTPANDITASIILSGPVRSPSISFSSTPALPNDEVLSHILFGKDSARISPFQALQLARTIQRFSGEGGGGLDPVEILRSTTGLDDISIDTSENGDTSVGVGKYLTDKVYLEVQKGKAEDSGAATIQIEVTPNINVESRIGQDAQTGGGILWKHDY